MNGFRKACLDCGKILMMNNVKLNKFEKLFKVKMYKIENKKKEYPSISNNYGKNDTNEKNCGIL
jgi:hypothetical protein